MKNFDGAGATGRAWVRPKWAKGLHGSGGSNHRCELRKPFSVRQLNWMRGARNAPKAPLPDPPLSI